jgi:hypothetical protein
MSDAAARTITEYLDRVAEPYRADAWELHKLIRATVPNLRPFLISGMIGYGVVGLAGRKNGLALHVTLAVDGKYLTESVGDRVGKADVGKSCIRFRRLSDLDQKTIVALLQSAGKAAVEQQAK